MFITALKLIANIPSEPPASFAPWLWNALLAVAVVGLVLNMAISWRKLFGGKDLITGAFCKDGDYIRAHDFSLFRSEMEQKHQTFREAVQSCKDAVQSCNARASMNESGIRSLLEKQIEANLQIAQRLARIEERSEMGARQMEALFGKIDRCRVAANSFTGDKN